MSKPDFFILGPPKCGTTSLAHWLAGHPNVFIPPLKEPHFFCTDLNNRVITDRAKYYRLFSGAEEHSVIGEASTWYLFSRDAVRRIEREVPNAKYMVILRDPVEMAISLYHHNRRSLYEPCTTFEEAWALQEERKSGKYSIANCPEPAYLLYREACSLRDMTARLLRTVDCDRVHFISFEQLKREPKQVYESTLTFLGIPSDFRHTFPVHNRGSDVRSRYLQQLIRAAGYYKSKLGMFKSFGLSRINAKPLSQDNLSLAFVERLRNEFANQFPSELLENLP